MPEHKACDSLYRQCVEAASALLLKACQQLDKALEPLDPTHLQRSPPAAPSLSPSRAMQGYSPQRRHVASPARDQVDNSLMPAQREVRRWLANLPDTVVEDVLTSALLSLEAQLIEDKDKKLIMSLINIDRLRYNDFFFGIHSLLSILKGFNLSRIDFTKRLWYCLWEYDQIINSYFLLNTVCDLLPHVPLLTSLNVCYVADNSLMYHVARYLPHLRSLNVSYSRVSDKGLKYLATTIPAASVSSPTRPAMPSPSVARNISAALLDHLPSSPPATGSDVTSTAVPSTSSACISLLEVQAEQPPPLPLIALSSLKSLQPLPEQSVTFQSPLRQQQPASSAPQPHPRNSLLTSRLEYLNLDSCDAVTEAGVKFMLEHFKNLKVLIYHQRRSVMEILIKWSRDLPEEELVRGKWQLNLEHLEHGFPYGLTPWSEQMKRLHMLCPNLTNINLVTDDKIMPELIRFEHLDTVTVELEDYMGEGLLQFLRQRGSQLTSISVSCSADPDVALDNGGQQGQLFNLGVMAVGLYCPQIRKLSVSGCGLVSQEALQQLGLIGLLGTPGWLRNQNWFSQLDVLILMSYEDSLPSMTIHSGLLRSVLQTAKRLSILSLEGIIGSVIDDNFLSQILSANDFSSLRILDIAVNDFGGVPGRVPLTSASVTALLERCPRLAELRVSDWSLSDVDFAAAEAMAAANNWNLRLTRKLRS